MSDTGIIIVTYNSGADIGACLDSVITSEAEIVVVDNSSADNTLEEVRRRRVRLIANRENRGFAGAVNQGFRALDTRFVLLLNPDAILQTSLVPLEEACQLPGVAAAGGRTLDSHGKPQAGWMFRRLPTPAALCLEVLFINRLWPDNPVNWRFRCLDSDLQQSEPVAVEQPAGAFFMVRRDAWQKIGGFDEGFYPLWFEDVDFCRRLKDAGLGIVHVPAAVVTHTGGHSIRKMPLEFRELYWYGSLLRYASRHFSPVYRRLVCSSVVAGSVIRAIARLFNRDGWRALTVYWKIVGLASRYFFSPQPDLKSLFQLREPQDEL
jgi:N-acetylglucosaminyl-diphospho-decaprenol L-rhamnosyltransferase